MPKKPWFPHDIDASADRKLVILAMERGYCAVGRWWNLVEYLTGLDGYRMEIDEMTPAALSRRWTTPVEPCSTTEAMDLLNSFVTRYKLLKRMGSHIWSDSLMRRMDEYNAALDRFSKAGRASSEVRKEKYGSASPKRLPTAMRTSKMNVVHGLPEQRSSVHERCSTFHEPFLPSSLPTREEGIKSPPPPGVPTSKPVYVGAVGAPIGAAAPTNPEHDTFDDDPETTA